MRQALENLALYIQHEQQYRYGGPEATLERLHQAFAQLRERACAACRDPERDDAEQWDCCVVFAGDGALHLEDLDDD